MTSGPKWNLSSLFHGCGEKPSDFQNHLTNLEEQIESLINQLREKPLTCESISLLQTLAHELSEASTLVSCLVSQDTSDGNATAFETKLNVLSSRYETAMILLETKLTAMSEQEFKNWLEKEDLKEIAFRLKELRTWGKEKLSKELETLITDLSISGHHAYTNLYYTLMGSISFKNPNGDAPLNLGQLENFLSHQNREVRLKAAKSLETNLQEHSPLFAQILNALTDYRLRIYKQRGWNSFLKETLHQNRMKEETLDAMWEAVNDHKEHLTKYLHAKAKLLNVEKISWCDLSAPVGKLDENRFNFETASQFVVDQFAKYSNSMAELAKQAINEHWIDARQGGKRRAGGWCTFAPLSNQSRIFMNWSNTFNSMNTLAHELGHAYHNVAIAHLPEMLQAISMNVAETASTTAEIIIGEAALKMASSKEEKQVILSDRLDRAVAFMMDINARFHFEKALHENRTQGFIPADSLAELTLNAQKEAFGHSLDNYMPQFYAYKMHFYFSELAFYNYPYTFGYLFSQGIFAKMGHTPEFEKNYRALLTETASMQVENLAKKHLDVDLTDKGFWNDAIGPVVKDVQEFCSL